MSPPKINSLFGQIASKGLRSIAKKVTVDLKILKAEFGPASAPAETVYSRLRVVLEYLDRHTMIGSIDEPGSYFAGRIPRSWGPYVDLDGGLTSGLVYFAGHAAKTTIGLGGSVEHMFGGPGDAPIHSHSATPALLEALYRELELDPGERELRFEGEGAGLSAVELATQQSRRTTQMLEFVAKRLIWGHAYNSPQEMAMLGTPLYVAAGD